MEALLYTAIVKNIIWHDMSQGPCIAMPARGRGAPACALGHMHHAHRLCVSAEVAAELAQQDVQTLAAGLGSLVQQASGPAIPATHLRGSTALTRSSPTTQPLSRRAPCLTIIADSGIMPLAVPQQNATVEISGDLRQLLQQL